MDEDKVIRPMDFVRLTNIDELNVIKDTKNQTEFVDGEKIKADTYYSLKGGVFVECIND